MTSCYYHLLLHSCVHLLLLLGQRVLSSNPGPIRVNYGYFPEASPIRVACARGWFTWYQYQVTCYPQTSGAFAASRLDSGSLHLADLGSTPLAQALARGVDIRVVFIDQYKGDSQGIYVRPTAIENPFDLIGKKLGVPFGSTMHYQVLFLLDIFDMTGQVELLNLSPAEIIQAWDDGSIDAAACWGSAREHVLDLVGDKTTKNDNSGANNDKAANVLVSAGVLADWGRPTFNVVAVDREFMNDHAEFVDHFVSILGLLTDSFIDKLGGSDNKNANRWTPNAADPESSYMPSLADAMMKAGERARNPSVGFVSHQRHALDLFKPLSTEEQVSCDYLGGGRVCGRPSLQHIAIQQTAEFLMDQKVIHDMGRLSDMGNTGIACSRPNTLCGGDLFTGSSVIPKMASSVEFRYDLASIYGSVNPDPFSLDFWDGLAPFYALNETGRAGADEFSAGHSTCISKEMRVATYGIQYFGDTFWLSPYSLVGQSYSDNLDCSWVIRSSDCTGSGSVCQNSVVISFLQVRVWSGDYIRVYSDPSMECSPDSTTKVLLGQITGLDSDLPNDFQAKGCVVVQFETDANQERSYNDIQNLGDGFSASYRDAGIKELQQSFTKHCLGTTHIALDGRNNKHVISDSDAESKTDYRYPNDLDCIWEVQAKGGEKYVIFDVEYDLEPTYDYLQLFSGTFGSTSGVTPYAFLSANSTKGTYYIPTDDSGFSTIRLVTDSLGRRSGFKASVYIDNGAPARNGCPNPGTSGLFCEIPHCVVENSVQREMGSSSYGVNVDYQIGRVVSQIRTSSIPPNTNCSWPFGKPLSEAQGIRLRFNFPLDLEPQPVSAVGDKIVVKAGGNVAAEVFVEKCDTDEVCSHSWQTGKCEDGACTVRQSFDVNIEDFSGGFKFLLVTDRSDGKNIYNGVDFDALFISSCPSGADVHCEADAGECMDGACVCTGNIPCACPCDVNRVVSKLNAALLWIMVPLVIIFVGIFVWYRRRKIRKSREQKAVIQEKEEQLEAFRNSVVGMRSATTHYMPKSILESDDAPLADELLPIPPPLETIQWCWQETPHMMSNHGPDVVVGNSADCWVKYDSALNTMIENAFQAYSDTGSTTKTTLSQSMTGALKNTISFYSPSVDDSKFIVRWDGYKVDVRDMQQTKEATGFVRDIQRITDVTVPAPPEAPIERNEIDLNEVEIGNSLPDELVGEPQMVLVKGDVVQISSQRQDGWAFGTKLHHNDEVIARELVRLTSKESADTNTFTDTGWFPLDITEIPSAEELAALQAKVGSTDALQAPSYWDVISDPTVVQLHKLNQSDKERETVVKAFMATLQPPRFSKKVEVVGVERIQNLAMWQSYVVKRQTICYRETGGTDSPNAMQGALNRFERHWLWHGTNVEVMDKIMQQGFNRSFCGKNATVYGKGVYFARDAEYSAYPTYAVPDTNKVQYMMACRVIVGEFCPGLRNALTPEIRDSSTQTLYDTTVGLLSNDTMENPSIYVTYHDAQAYPEYLIKFKQS